MQGRPRGLAIMVASTLALLLGAHVAVGQDQELRLQSLGQEMLPRIWDIPLGTHVSELPVTEFVDPACGTNGGPAGVLIGRFDEFMRCSPEPSGLREVWFIYDDELEYVARAIAPSAWNADPNAPTSIQEDRQVQRYRATQIMMHPIIVSMLIDEDGRMQGYRIFTDPRSAADLRMGAHTVATSLKGRYGLGGWECTDLPPAGGEHAIGTPPSERFIKERCEKTENGQHVVVETRFYYKAGQAALDPFTGRPMENAFESSSSLQVYASDFVAN